VGTEKRRICQNSEGRKEFEERKSGGRREEEEVKTTSELTTIVPLDPSIVTVLYQGQGTSFSDDDVDVSDDVEGGSVLDGEVTFEGRVGSDGEEPSGEDGDFERKRRERRVSLREKRVEASE